MPDQPAREESRGARQTLTHDRAENDVL